MPWRVSGEWLKQHGCPRRPRDEIPLPFVWTSGGEKPPESSGSVP